MKPNLVVGVVGLLVFLVALSVIVDGWREYTGFRTYQTEFETFEVRLPAPTSNTLPGGTQSRSESFRVTHANVSAASARVTWEESSLAPHEVTIVLRHPDGSGIGQATGRGGVAGLTVERELRAVPEPERFNEVNTNIAAEFEERYGNFTQDLGLWVVTITSKGPGGPTDSGISYAASFSYTYWSGRYAEVPELTR